MKEKTVFEKIIADEIPHHKVYEDDDTFAFLDAEPVNPGHTLVVPKQAHKDIYEIPRDDFLAVMETVHALAPKIKAAVSADGINIHNNNEPAAGQEVMHYHMHIIPRFANDGFEHWRGDDNYHDDERGEQTANNIRKEL